jgi:hypothetical protein
MNDMKRRDEMIAFAVDNMISELIYEAKIDIQKYAKCVLNLSRIGNIKGAERYRQKLSEARNRLRILRGAVARAGNGRFRKYTPQEFGIGDVCEECGHLLLRVYEGDSNSPFIDPHGFRYRCFTCEPEGKE